MPCEAALLPVAARQRMLLQWGPIPQELPAVGCM